VVLTVRLRRVADIDLAGSFGRLQNAVEMTQDCERENHFAVFGMFVVAAKEISDGPDEGGKVRI
jgi:hypothetical protein